MGRGSLKALGADRARQPPQLSTIPGPESGPPRDSSQSSSSFTRQGASPQPSWPFSLGATWARGKLGGSESIHLSELEPHPCTDEETEAWSSSHSQI